MRLEKEIIINDEPLVSLSTGVRKAKLTYTGPKYLYLEYDNVTEVIQVMVHGSDTPELEIAEEKLTPIEGREIIVIDAEETPIAATFFWSNYTLEIDNYEETLPNGEKYTYDYSSEPKTGEVFDFFKMKWNKDKNDFDEYKFIEHAVSDEEMVDSIDILLEQIATALSENTGLSSAERSEVNAYVEELKSFKNNIGQGVEHWKMPFPICKVAY